MEGTGNKSAAFEECSVNGDPFVVTAQWLKEKLESNPSPSEFMVLDTTWIPVADDINKQEYLKSHIPGAVHFDIDTAMEPTRLIPRNIPSGEHFEQYVRSLGINNNTHLIVYDRDNGELVTVSSYRARWLLKTFGHQRVSLLNGGLCNWQDQGYEVTETVPAPLPEGDFKHVSSSYALTYESMKDLVEGKQRQIIDARFPDNYTGKLPEPNDVTKQMCEVHNIAQLNENEIKGGHMPGSINVAYSDILVLPYYSLKSKEELIKLLKESGVDLDKPTVATCYIGHTACAMVLALEILGCPDTSVYYGSWTEWGQRAPQNLCEKD